VTETGSQAAEHGTLKLIIGGSDSHSPSVCLLLRVLWTSLVEVARFGVGLEATVCSVGKLGLGVSLDRGPTHPLCL
jgi:hypothetical protein